MDFVVGLPRTQSGYDSLWIIMDQLTKEAHFIPVKMTYTNPQLVLLCRSRVVCLHGVSKQIVPTRGIDVILKFWERLHKTMDTHLNFSSAYHPQNDRQTD
jgi:hypothetical protein